jgi:UDP:flavonoid glycosyltransferase YjiC (YdhE family)
MKAESSDSSAGASRKKRVLFCCHGSRGDVQPLVALALGMLERGDYEVAFWTVRPVNEFVERQGLPCMVHDLDTDELMRRVQTKINAGVHAAKVSRGLGFFSAVSDVMEEKDIAPKVHSFLHAWPF